MKDKCIGREMHSLSINKNIHRQHSTRAPSITSPKDTTNQNNGDEMGNRWYLSI